MAIPDEGAAASAAAEGKGWGLCRMPMPMHFWGGGGGGSSSASPSPAEHHHHHRMGRMGQMGQMGDGAGAASAAAAAAARRSGGSSSVSSVARSLLPVRRRLRLDPPTKLYFPYEPGKQVRSAVRIKNTSKSHVAFKFVEHPENNEKPLEQKSKVKFKIVSLKVKGQMEYVPELFDEQRDQVAVEQILRVVFLDVDRPSPQMDKLKRLLAEAEAALEARKKPPEDTGHRVVGEGLVIDEWKERREKYLARQQVEGVVDSV
ncbi:Vesicle-associated protein 4-2 [Ananas comosus]|uniref:Vesicle-associated protein 4-2 n=1 Tax=Ananas comosus TaxID=4615 RepID=A0A199V8V1_ANACO|nr:Vesicle-associated protein 4-2 [Ananas comosus]